MCVVVEVFDAGCEKSCERLIVASQVFGVVAGDLLDGHEISW